MKPVRFLPAALAALVVLACEEQPTSSAVVTASAENCLKGPLVETDGHRRLALVVGVSEYANPKIAALPGAAADANRIVDLLSSPGGYGFPRENICLLLNSAATGPAFIDAFREFLIEQAKAGDIAVIYFAGHGSQIEDFDGDESDALDETLAFHDARVNGGKDIVDDQLNGLLSELAAKTANVSVILDSCTSGTATREAGGARRIARYLAPDPNGSTYASGASSQPDNGLWKSKALENVVVFAAAADGTPAYEFEGHGIFTDALVRVAGLASERPLTYRQLEQRLRPLVAAVSDQAPEVEGLLDRVVFDNVQRRHPLGLKVDRVDGPSFTLSGPPLAGLGPGAELRIYDAAATFGEMLDPSAMKGLLRVESAGSIVQAIRTGADNGDAIAAGDLAVLARPSADTAKLTVRFVSTDDGRNAMKVLKGAVETALADTVEGAATVELSETRGEFGVFVSGDGAAVVTGPDGEARALDQSGQLQATTVAHRLVGLARQRAILGLQGEPGAVLADGGTLELRAEPVAGSQPCGEGTWSPALPGQEQVIPLCQEWKLRVTASETLKAPVRATAVALSADGSIFVLGNPGGYPLSRPGESVVLDIGGRPIVGRPPLGASDFFVAFATPETAQNDFSSLEWQPDEPTAARSIAPRGALSRMLDRFVSAGVRSGGQTTTVEKDSVWSVSVLATRVEANPSYSPTGSGTREYGVPDFDFRPYLPPDRTSPLFRVLEVANSLTTVSPNGSSPQTGYAYRQHPWSKTTDEENLEEGIDCSRAIWFAFTRAGVPYTKENRYIATADMTEASAAMSSEFEACGPGPSLIGDVLVYRDAIKGDGHVVMVVDPQRRIAWGSHGWDGEPTPVRGVGYQRIKNKKDWALWDRPTMKQVACWRHPAFTRQLATPIGRPSMMAGDAQACRVQCRAPGGQ